MRRWEIERHLRANFDGEARFDPVSRALYATDASNHQIDPIGIAFPQHPEHLQLIVELANELEIPLLPRGSGTSLSGAAVGEALILDCSKHMQQIRRLDPEEAWATVEPGVYCSTLNAAAAPHRLKFGPDPASADRATFGGMIGNNATGAHSIQYGMTADHVLAVDVILSDGSTARFEDLSLERAQQLAGGSSLEARIYQAVLGMRQDARPAVERNWPRTWRRSSGYSLNYAMGYSPNRPPAWHLKEHAYPPTQGVNLGQVLCGSEGTLAIIAGATVRLVPEPNATVLVVLDFDSVEEACDLTPAILEAGPTAVELIPRMLIQQARTVPAYARKLGFVEGDPPALLVVEFSGRDEKQAAAKAGALPKRGRMLRSLQDQADLWSVRKVGLGLLMSVPGSKKPITFIEDVAVPVESLGDYVRAVNGLLEEEGTSGEWYAHASAGCLHLRPLIDLKTAAGVKRMRAIADGVTEIVIQLGGAISGEHGDGLSHTEFNPRLFGPEITQAFRQLKTAFDPRGLLNPGKVVPAEGAEPQLDRNLRYGPTYASAVGETSFTFSREGGFDLAIEDCTGVGSCRKHEGVMCPSFQATRDERHSTRGRANALRMAISGQLPMDDKVLEVLDLCLECKGCKAECPTKVDMARLKAEALWQRGSFSLRSRFFAHIARWSRWGRWTSPIYNAVRGTRLVRWLGARLLGVAPERTFPPLAPRPFTPSSRAHGGQLQVVLFVDTFTRFNEPELGRDAEALLHMAGYEVLVADGQACCGRPMISKGLLGQARRAARRNIDALYPHARRGIPIVGLEPSCLLTLRDEYLDFFPHDLKARALAERALMMEEFLLAPNGNDHAPIERLSFERPDFPLSLHAHCHMKSLVGSRPTLQLLRATGAQVREIPSGCCGMAGSFGYEKEHYDLSMQIGELVLFPAVRRAAARKAQIVAHGTSCRTQIADGTGERAWHPVQVLAKTLHQSRSKISK